MATIDLREKITPNEGVDETEVKPDEVSGEEDEEEAIAEPKEETPPEEASTSNGEETELEKEAKALEAIRLQKAELLKDVTDLRTERREIRAPGGVKAQPIIVDAPKDDELADVDPAAVAMIERVIKAKGYVQKGDLDSRDTTRSVKSEQDTWLDKHPEYKPENDPDDEKWKQLSSVVKMFALPSNPKDVQRILDMAHRELGGTAAVLPVKSAASAAAQTQKTKVSGTSGGGGAAKAATSSNGKVDLSMLKGFTAEELADLQS